MTSNSEVSAKLDGEPINDFHDRDEADPKTETTNSSKAGKEVKPSHPRNSLKLCKRTNVFHDVCFEKIMFQPNAVVSAKNKLSTAMSRSYALYSGSI